MKNLLLTDLMENKKCFPCKSEKLMVLNTAVLTSTRRQEKKMKPTDIKGKSKTVFIGRLYDLLHRKHQRIYKKVPRSKKKV